MVLLLIYSSQLLRIFFDTGKINIDPVDRALIISSNTREENFDQLNEKEMVLIKEICSLWKDRHTQDIVNFTHEQKTLENVPRW